MYQILEGAIVKEISTVLVPYSAANERSNDITPKCINAGGNKLTDKNTIYARTR